jgi:tyrosine-protein phosphatase SIW14
MTPIFLTPPGYGTNPSQSDPPSAPMVNQRAPRAIARKLSVEGVPNLEEVTPTLYRGGQPSTVGFQNLARMGINIVVDGRGGLRKQERDRVTGLGMQYVAIPWHCPFPKDSVFARFLSVIRQNPGKKIFVHCRLGDDRVGMMIAAYRMAEQGWTADQAMQEMKAYGFSPLHHLICPGLARYEKHFPQRYKTKSAFRSLR